MADLNNASDTGNAESTDVSICFPGTYDENSPWRLYNRLIAEIPDDISVRDYELGDRWSYVEADCGMGLAFTCCGGAPHTYASDLRGLPLKSVAELSKSWCFEEASLGVAALNAYYMQRELLDSIGAFTILLKVRPPHRMRNPNSPTLPHPPNPLRRFTHRQDAMPLTFIAPVSKRKGMQMSSSSGTFPTLTVLPNTRISPCLSAIVEAISTCPIPPANTCCPKPTMLS